MGRSAQLGSRTDPPALRVQSYGRDMHDNPGLTEEEHADEEGDGD